MSDGPEPVEIISARLKDPNLKPHDGSFQSVDPGTYEFEIEKWSTGTSRNNNNTLKLTARVVAPEDSPMRGRTMMNSYVIDETSDFACGRLKSLTDATGIPVTDAGGFAPATLIGARFEADVEKRAITKVDKMGTETPGEFTSWLRERPVGSGPAQTNAAPAAKPMQQAAPSNAPRRPQAPPTSGNGRPQPPRS
jgi:hypothetical protein